MKTKVLHVITILFTAILLLFAGCEQPIEPEPTPEPIQIVIKNQSAYNLTNVMWDNTELGTLARNESKTISVTGNKSGYISFTRDDIKINCRTNDFFTGDKSEFVFIDSTLVKEVEDSNNINLLSKISFLSSIALIYDGRNIAQNDHISFGEILINDSKTISFRIKNNGDGKLLLAGNLPVTIEDTNNVFTITQPSQSEVLSGESLEFSIAFTTNQAASYTGKVSIASNDASGDISFFVDATGRGQTLTIKNESSYDVSTFKWNSYSFETKEADGILKPSEQSKIEIATEDISGGHLIFHRLGEDSMVLRTKDVITVTKGIATVFVLTDQSLVIDNNYAFASIEAETLKAINPRPEIEVWVNNRKINTGETIPFPNTPAELRSELVFTVKSVGTGNLMFNDNQAINITDPSFSAKQPESSIAPSESATFSMYFLPTEVKTFSSPISIGTNAFTDYSFEFVISGEAIPFADPQVQNFKVIDETDTHMTFSWDSLPLAIDYRIFYAQENDFSKAIPLRIDTNKTTLTKLSSQVGYYFWIQPAYAGGKIGLPSNSISGMLDYELTVDYAVSGTFTYPYKGVKTATVSAYLRGAGGGGQGGSRKKHTWNSDDQGCGGGGGGGAASFISFTLQPGDAITIDVKSGGHGGGANWDNYIGQPGGNGGATTMTCNELVAVANGGLRGGFSGNVGGPGGATVALSNPDNITVEYLNTHGSNGVNGSSHDRYDTWGGNSGSVATFPAVSSGGKGGVSYQHSGNAGASGFASITISVQ